MVRITDIIPPRDGLWEVAGPYLHAFMHCTTVTQLADRQLHEWVGVQVYLIKCSVSVWCAHCLLSQSLLGLWAPLRPVAPGHKILFMSMFNYIVSGKRWSPKSSTLTVCNCVLSRTGWQSKIIVLHSDSHCLLYTLIHPTCEMYKQWFILLRLHACKHARTLYRNACIGVSFHSCI